MMNTIMYANILLAVIISACAAAGLTDEQLAKIFNEKPGRDNSLSETRRDYASIQDISDLDQALTTLLGDTDDTPELESIFGDDMANNLKEANQRTLDILLDANDRGPADNSDLDFAFLQQDLVTSGAMSAVDDQSHNTDPNVPTDMTACLYTYKQNYALCSGLLNERNIQYDGDENYCTTRSCMEKLETLFKRSIKRDKPTECQTMGCKFTKYVKKSFCNRYGCGRRRKKTYSQHMIDRHGVVYPALTNVNVFGLPVSQRGYTSTKQTRSADTGAGVRQIPMCGSSTEGCIRKNTNRRRKRPKVKTVEMN